MSQYRWAREFFWVLLLPLSLLWSVVTYCRRRFYPGWRKQSFRFPILCVGNLHSGGSGKTPLVMELVERLAESGPAVLARGYRGTSSRSGAQVAESLPQKYGDEACTLAERVRVPVYVGRDRARMLKALEKESSIGIVVMDDGFQHLKVRRHTDLVVIGSQRSPSDAFCLPYGDLREPMAALKQAAAIIVVKEPRGSVDEWRRCLSHCAPATPVFQVERKLCGLWDGSQPFSPQAGMRFAAFCGIAEPGRFESDLGKLGNAELVATFPDHHWYTSEELMELVERRKARGCDLLLTTEKDAVKARQPLQAQGERLLTLRIGYDIPPEFWYFLGKRLER